MEKTKIFFVGSLEIFRTLAGFQCVVECRNLSKVCLYMRLHLLLSLLFNRVSVVRMSALAAPFISVHDEAPKTYPKISENEPVVTVTGFHDIGIICSDITQSKDFYEKIGFNLVAEKTSDKVTVLCNKGGMEAHLSVCDKPIDDNLNILMDYPVNKYPGHTHASFQVPNVASTQTYLESQGIAH